MRLLGGSWDGLTEADWKFYMQMYANDPAELEESPYANLFLNDMTRDMPACYIAAAEYDPLRDDSTTLATICEEYGVPYRFRTVRRRYPTRFCTTPRCLTRRTTPLSTVRPFYRQQMGL
ncbi:alpha/beta hydrolase fold domain-containing protein [Paraeggerthella sp.]|uniref:alpha/beta hydrolase fold domain-containing protein n=1 Tax=Paraeggerthella sp. TaxID=2897350 RepID=UPI0035289845